MSSLGLVFQPMTAVTLFYMRWALGGKNDFQTKHQKVLEELQAKYQTIFSELKAKSTGQVMFFRFGSADDISFRTLRDNVE